MMRTFWSTFCAVSLTAALVRADGRQFKTFSTRAGWPADQITAVTQDKNGDLWFGTLGAGAFQFDGKKFTAHRRSKDGLPSNFVRTVYRDRDGRVWLGTENDGAVEYDGKTFVTYNARNSGLASNSVRCILQDRRGQYWFGTDRGLYRWNGQDWTSYHKADSDLPDHSIHALTEDNDDRLWVVTARGLGRFDGRRWQVWDKKSMGLGESLTAVTSDGQGHIWLGTENAAIVRFDGKRFVKQNPRGWYGGIHCAYRDREGQLWFGTDAGIAITFDGRGFADVNIFPGVVLGSERLQRFIIRGIFQDAEGHFWFATSLGAVRWDARPPAVRIAAPEKITAEQKLTLQFHGDDGRFGTRPAELEYAYRIDEGPWSKFSRQAGVTVANLPPGAHRVQVQARDRSGNVSAPADKTVLIEEKAAATAKTEPAPRALKASPDIRLTQKPPPVGRKRDLYFEFAPPEAGGPPPALLYSHRLAPLEEHWSEFSATPFVKYAHVKSGAYVFLLRVKDEANNVRVPVAYDFKIESAPLALALTRNITRETVAFEFAAKGDGAQPESVKFAHRLYPKEKEWSEFDSATRKEYRNLPRGRYLFQVRARDMAENREAGEELAFEITGAEAPRTRILTAVPPVWESDEWAVEFTGEDGRTPAGPFQYSHRLLPVETRWSAPSPERRLKFARLAPGKYVFEVRAIDAEGNADKEPAQAVFSVRLPEALSARVLNKSDFGPATAGGKVRFNFAAAGRPDAAGRMQYSWILSRVDKGWSEFSAQDFAEYDHLPNGDYTFIVAARDADGRIYHPDRVEFTVRIPEEPTVTLKSAPPERIEATAVRFQFSGQDNKTPADKLLYSWRLFPVEKEWSAYTNASGKRYDNLPRGGHYKFEVRAKDEDGNESRQPASVSFYVAPLMETRAFRGWIFAACVVSVLSVFSARALRARYALRRKINPYIVGKPVQRADMFFGREKVLAAISANVHNNSLLIHGERRIGKTSLLHQTKRRLAAEEDAQYKFLPVYIDLEGIAEARFFYTIGAEVLKEFKTEITDRAGLRLAEGDAAYSAEDLARDLMRIIKILGRRVAPKERKLVLLIDEADQMNGYDRQTHQRFRSLFMDTFAENLVAVMAGSEIKKKWEGLTSPWYNFFMDLALGPFTEKEAAELIRRPVKGLYTYEAEAVRRLLVYSERRPYLIQKYCALVVERVLDQKRRNITADDVEWVRSQLQGHV